jgi:desulfoferrodoxin (superoxide reductase-like protein)
MKIFLVVLFILVFFVPVFSNPPEDITINISDSNMEVFVQHPSENPAKHFIKSIQVSFIGMESGKQYFSKQDKDGQRASFSVDGLKKGDAIRIRAACSIYGVLEKEFSMP